MLEGNFYAPLDNEMHYFLKKENIHNGYSTKK